MSVTFEKQTVRNSAPVVGRDNDTAHKIGEALTGGKSQTGYLAVSRVIQYTDLLLQGGISYALLLGIPAAATVESPSHKDAHIWRALRTSGSPRIMARARQE